MVNWLLRGGRVADGLGSPLRRADLAIIEGRVHLLDPGGRVPPGCREIDASDRVVAPGFIDIHAHNDLVAVSDGDLDDKIAQGVTTEVNGNCGFSPFPLTDLNRRLQPELLAMIAPGRWEADWCSWADYAAAVTRNGTPVNVIGQVGHGALRSAVMGMEMREPNAAEMERMRAMLATCMDEGASGLSFGLMYHPSGFADAAEIAALCDVAAGRDGFVSVHLRGYDSGALLAGMEEMLVAAQTSRVRLQLSHLAPSGPDAAAMLAPMIERVDRAIADGCDIGMDRYPYEHAFTRLSLLFPAWALAGGDEAVKARLGAPLMVEQVIEELDRAALYHPYDAVRLIGPDYGDWQDLTLAEVAQALDITPGAAAIQVLRRFGSGARITILLSDMDIQREIICHPSCMIGSDGMPSRGATHPRTFGTFARILGAFVRDGSLTLEGAIHKMTGQPAQWLGLPGRGVIGEGMIADLVLFSPETIADRSSFADPYREPSGIDAVFVNGQAARLDGRSTGVRAGRVLSVRRPHR